MPSRAGEQRLGQPGDLGAAALAQGDVEDALDAVLLVVERSRRAGSGRPATSWPVYSTLGKVRPLPAGTWGERLAFTLNARKPLVGWIVGRIRRAVNGTVR